MEKTDKEEIIKEFAIHTNDTGSSSVQIAVLTRRIKEITEHLKEHRKDQHSHYGLLKLVQRRRKLLRYLQKKNPERHKNISEKLNIRR